MTQIDQAAVRKASRNRVSQILRSRGTVRGSATRSARRRGIGSPRSSGPGTGRNHRWPRGIARDPRALADRRLRRDDPDAPRCSSHWSTVVTTGDLAPRRHELHRAHPVLLVSQVPKGPPVPLPPSPPLFNLRLLARALRRLRAAEGERSGLGSVQYGCEMGLWQRFRGTHGVEIEAGVRHGKFWLGREMRGEGNQAGQGRVTGEVQGGVQGGVRGATMGRVRGEARRCPVRRLPGGARLGLARQQGGARKGKARQGRGIRARRGSFRRCDARQGEGGTVNRCSVRPARVYSGDP